MAYDLVNLKTIKELSAAGSVRTAQVVGACGGFAVQFNYGLAIKTLQAKRGNPRIFRTLDAVAKTVRGIGVARLEADLAGWNPVEPSLRVRDEKALAHRQLQKAMTTIRRRAESLSPEDAQRLADEATLYARTAQNS
ncbi:MAG: hypothetical protein WC091_16450 [Sulfuricellaceae bacterium]